jgi:hypothetical protein
MSLMAKGSKVTPTSHSNITPNEESDDEDDSDDERNMSFLREMAVIYHSLRGNNNARAKFENLLDTVYKNKESIEELESHVENGRMRFNLLKQELRDEKRTTFLLTQKIESYEVEKGKYTPSVSRYRVYSFWHGN